MLQKKKKIIASKIMAIEALECAVGSIYLVE